MLSAKNLSKANYNKRKYGDLRMSEIEEQPEPQPTYS